VDLGGDPVWVWCLMGFWGGSERFGWGSEISLKEYWELKGDPSWSENSHIRGGSV